MRDIIEADHHLVAEELKPENENGRDRKNLRRWLWFAGIYVASLLVFSTVVYVLRWMIRG